MPAPGKRPDEPGSRAIRLTPDVLATRTGLGVFFAPKLFEEYNDVRK